MISELTTKEILERILGWPEQGGLRLDVLAEILADHELRLSEPVRGETKACVLPAGPRPAAHPSPPAQRPGPSAPGRCPRGRDLLPTERYGPPSPGSVGEWDRRRQYLAEELLKIAVDEQHPGNFSDSEPVRDPDPNSFDTKAVITVEQWFLKLAHAALAAAEVIYPDIEQPVLPLAAVPAAARAGAAAVMPTTVTPTGD